jgi:hypothetical protein
VYIYISLIFNCFFVFFQQTIKGFKNPCLFVLFFVTYDGRSVLMEERSACESHPVLFLTKNLMWCVSLQLKVKDLASIKRKNKKFLFVLFLFTYSATKLCLYIPTKRNWMLSCYVFFVFFCIWGCVHSELGSISIYISIHIYIYIYLFFISSILFLYMRNLAGGSNYMRSRFVLQFVSSANVFFHCCSLYVSVCVCIFGL